SSIRSVTCKVYILLFPRARWQEGNQNGLVAVRKELLLFPLSVFSAAVHLLVASSPQMDVGGLNHVGCSGHNRHSCVGLPALCAVASVADKPSAISGSPTFGGPFPIQICFVDVCGILHRLGRDRLKGLAMAIGNTNGGTDLQPFGAEVTGVG